MCCRAYTAKCLSCVHNQTIDEFCKGNPKVVGCNKPRACCLAMTASCLACAKGITPEEYCVEHPTTAGCDIYSTAAGDLHSAWTDEKSNFQVISLLLGLYFILF